MSLILLDPDPKSTDISHQSLVGTLIRHDGEVGRVVGCKIVPPDVHECCFNAEFWQFSVEIDGEIQEWGPLLRTGGDLLCLSLNVQDTLLSTKNDQCLESCEFKTTKVKIDHEALEFISKYYPDLSFESDMVVCLGSVCWEPRVNL